jgi:hypothetical protein
VIRYPVMEQVERIENPTPVELALFDSFQQVGEGDRGALGGRARPRLGLSRLQSAHDWRTISHLVTRLRTRECLGVSGRLHAPGVREIEFRSHCPRLDQPELRRAEARGC